MVQVVVSGRHRIPVRNVWLLMLYASDLFPQLEGRRRASVEDNPEDIPDLVAEILAHEVERRLSRNLSTGWRRREADLTRVRGRVNLRRTESRQLLSRGKVACRYDEITIDTPRNRLVRAALAKLSGVVRRSELAHRCRSLAMWFERLGVAGDIPSRTVVSVDNFGRFDSNDRMMVQAAMLAFDLDIPSEEDGNRLFRTPPRDDIRWLRELFERAIAGFYRVTLSPSGWSVKRGRKLNWPQVNPSPGVAAILPSMTTDVELEHPDLGCRIVIDTKFTAILTSSQYRSESLYSPYIYQIYCYLRSQEGDGNPLSANAVGILLYPSNGKVVDEAVVIQGHPIRFATVDLSAETSAIRKQLLALVEPHPSHTGI